MPIPACFVVCVLVFSLASAAESPLPTEEVIQVVTLADGRTLEGTLNAERTEIRLLDGKTGKTIARIPVDPSQIVSVIEKRATAPAPVVGDVADTSATPEERERIRAERTAMLALTKVTQAKGRTARAHKANADLHARNHGRTLSPEAYKLEMAKYPKAEKEIANAEQAEQAARSALVKAVDEYRKLGGDKTFTEP